MKKYVVLAAVLLVAAPLCFRAMTSNAQQTQTAPQGQRPPGGMPRNFGIEDLSFEEHAGFESIFDGKTLTGWDGDSAFWRVENGVILGESTVEKPLKVNTFLIWRGGQPKDFELKLEFRLNSTNSGIQYRSVEMPDIGKWVLKGYQADIDFQNQFTGQLYEERGRGFLALRGQATQILSKDKKRLIANLKSGDDLKAAIKVNDWNQFHIVAHGNILTHIMNGQLMAYAVDDDPQNRAMGGLIGFQMHVGPPMKVEYRNIWLKNL